MKSNIVALELGLKLKHFRKEKKLSLDALAQLSGVSKGYLSRIESGQNDPTYSIILKICRGMNINSSALFADDNGINNFAITKVADRRRFVYTTEHGEYIQWELCSNIRHKKLETQLLEVPFDNHTLYEYDDERFFYVLSGQIRLNTGDILEAGDTIYLTAHIKHGAVSIGNEIAKVILVSAK